MQPVFVEIAARRSAEFARDPCAKFSTAKIVLLPAWGCRRPHLRRNLLYPIRILRLATFPLLPHCLQRKAANRAALSPSCLDYFRAWERFTTANIIRP